MTEFRKSKVPPVIILGMHRSGTSMITRMLETLGLFVGAKKDDNSESLFFFELNHFLFKVGVSKTDFPMNMEHMNPNCRMELARVVDHHLAHGRIRSFLGNHSVRDIRDLEIPWGWKEPRNTFALNIYRELFPDARIVHIYRHPLDTVLSYRKRDLDRRNDFRLTWRKKLKRRFLYADKYHQNFRLQTLDEGYLLWNEYVEKALSWEEAYGDRMKTLKYEDFLEQPAPALRDLAHFCGLEPEMKTVEKICARVDDSRKYAFTEDGEAVEFYRKINDDPLLERLGYGRLLP